MNRSGARAPFSKNPRALTWTCPNCEWITASRSWMNMSAMNPPDRTRLMTPKQTAPNVIPVRSVRPRRLRIAISSTGLPSSAQRLNRSASTMTIRDAFRAG